MLVTNKVTRKPNTACCICGKRVYRRPYEIEKTKGRIFCSSSCYGISCRKEVACLVCGKQILSRFNKKTCSRVCANRSRKGIRYKLDRPEDKAEKIKSLKLKLIELRGQACERCTYNKVKVLQVHHKNRNHDDNRIENLELVCPNCHYEEHASSGL
ncbi:MAG: hypothetical protein RIQ41_51 [Candidatus Parcubacteria bacterium]